MTRKLLLLAVPALVACRDKGDDTAVAEAEILDPEPAGAPEDLADGRLTCVGKNAPPDPIGGVVELPGYVRTYADPSASGEVPDATVQIYDADDNNIGTGYADTEKAGRVAVSVPVTGEGFTGYARITSEGLQSWRMAVSRPVTNSDFAGWTWMYTEEERDTLAEGIGIAVDTSAGQLMGTVHDCDGFGVANAVVVIDGSTEGVYYVEGFEPVTGRTYTSTSGRFVVPNFAPGPVSVKAFGRLEDGGPLVLLSSIATEVDLGGATSVTLQPRVGVE